MGIHTFDLLRKNKRASLPHGSASSTSIPSVIDTHLHPFDQRPIHTTDMSAEAKPVEVTPQTEAPVETPKPVETAPVVEPTTTEPTTTTTETPVVAEAPKEEVTEAAPVKEEVKPVEEGVLGYKGPGLLKSFIFQKKFFYFGTEPVESKTLSSYLRGEKAQDTANKNVAWAAHTGKGLLFFTKKASEKATPAGIINLSDVSDITEEGTVDFHFTLGGHKHTFQANTLGDRDNWVAVLKTKVAEAKELAPTVVETEEYKKAHADLTKPAVVAAAAAAPKKSVEKPEALKEEKKEEEKAEEKAEKAEEKKEIKEEKKEEKKARKSRSASRKRNSIFGNFGIGKKEEKAEEKKETPATTEETAAPAPAVEEPVVAATEPVVAPETTATEPTPAATEATPAAPVEARPAASKRNSIFGTLKSQFSQHKEKKPETEAAPAVPAKETE